MVRRAPVVGASLLLCVSACSLGVAKTGSPPPSPAAAKRGGVLKVGIVVPGGIDPLDAYEPAGKLVSTTMCDTTVSLDPDTGQVREALAGGWVVSNDNSITVKLRHGLKFNDGSTLTSKDVNYSLQQLVAPTNAAYSKGLATPFQALTASKAQPDLLADPTTAADVATSVSSYDFRVTRTTADGGALRSFAEPAMAPTARSAASADLSDGVDPVCVGPYKLKTPYKSGDATIDLVRSASYYGQNSGYTGGGYGYADEIVFSTYQTEAAALAAYDAGSVDVVQVSAGQAASTDAASRVYGLGTGVEYVGLPGDADGAFGNADLRIALSEALDRTQLVTDVFGPSTQPATGFEPPALAISKGPSLEGKTIEGAPLASCDDATPSAPDVTGAKAHLATAQAAAGAKPLTGFTLEVNDDAPYPALAAELAAQWKANLGLDVTVVKTPWTDYATKATGAGLDTPFRIRWSTDTTAPTATFNDQQSYLAPLFSAASTQLANWAHWTDRDFEQGLADDADPATDVAQRGIAFAKLSSILCQQMPLIPLVFDRPTYLVRPTALGSARDLPVGRDGVLLLRELYVKTGS